MSGAEDTRGGAGATAAVLWLMILIVFLPIALFHAFAVHSVGRVIEVHAATAVRPGS